MRKLSRRSFDDLLTASGTFACTGRKFHVLLGFFNAGTLNEWRTPNTIALRLSGRGDVFYAFVEYTTAKWRAGGDSPGGFATMKDAKTGRTALRGFKTGVAHAWSITYDPAANNGGGVVFATGTPIANSMAEMFTMQRYLQPLDLHKHNLHHFDGWAATFGEPVTAMELSPDGAGYRLVPVAWNPTS